MIQYGRVDPARHGRTSKIIIFIGFFIRITQNFISRNPVGNESVLVQVMAWR